MGSIAESVRPSGERNGNQPLYSGLGNLMDRGAWRAMVHGGCRDRRVRHDLATKQPQQHTEPACLVISGSAFLKHLPSAVTVLCMCVLAKSPQLCPTLFNPMDCGPPGFSVRKQSESREHCNPMDNTARGTLQARILEWVAFPSCRGSSQPRDQTQVSHIEGRFFTKRVMREAHEKAEVQGI